MKISSDNSTYGYLIEEMFLQEWPGVRVGPEAEFESLSRAVIGSKQRRHGPLPPPEQQVAIRDLLRRNDTITFFVPWGGSKQTDGDPFDVLDFAALRQLYCLREDVGRCGKKARFVFRVEDLTDLVLFGDPDAPNAGVVSRERRKQISEYSLAVSTLAKDLGMVSAESDFTSKGTFLARTDYYTPLFAAVLRGSEQAAVELEPLGWRGGVSDAQRVHYEKVARAFYPNTDPLVLTARYFAAVLARSNLNAGANPEGDYIHISFVGPVPNIPNQPQRPTVHYRSVPECWTHIHTAPWLGKGYLSIKEDQTSWQTTVVPKIARFGETYEWTKHSITVDNIQVQCDYLVT